MNTPVDHRRARELAEHEAGVAERRGIIPPYPLITLSHAYLDLDQRLVRVLEIASNHVYFDPRRQLDMIEAICAEAQP